MDIESRRGDTNIFMRFKNGIMWERFRLFVESHLHDIPKRQNQLPEDPFDVSPDLEDKGGF